MDQFKSVIERYLAGNATRDEQLKLLEALRSGSLSRDYFEFEKKVWEESQAKSFSIKEWEAWMNVRKKIEQSTQHLQTPKMWMRIYKVASVIAILLTASIAVGIYSFNKQRVFVSTQPGQNLNILLPDNTHVILNSSSSLEYNPLAFVFTRCVNLNGEAYFDVSKNKIKPFFVNSNDLSIKVLGTRFNVTAYHDSDKYSVVLEEGVVKVCSHSNNNCTVTLKPGQKVDLYKGLSNWNIEFVNTRLYTSWTEGILYFYDSSFIDMALMMQRRYGVHIEVTDPKIRTFVISTTIRNEPLEQVLDLIQKVLPVEIHYDQPNIVISLDEARYEKYRGKLN